MEENAIKGTFATIVSLATYMWGGWDGILQAMVAVMALDYATGILKAIREKKLNSAVGAKGITKKIGYILILSLAHIVDNVMELSGILRNVCVYFFIANEGISILENLAAMDIIVPEKVKEMLEQLRDRRK